ncbi:hypothetical protein [Nonomuraea gerenzanensis]|uniref:Uncharacterized protein n=1 Tax=Nonomuraea gerenzanensis TaxID=93944 RepID=A0A1M4EEH0_9ACTN|nr:hypothetical protein [Nonomuraea gerenzanensis]UBU08999.1 hypothetical protein LCN96_32005 [Nonomuraea gerenzanensis]SBO97381.1 hypothetical protein BN4615_P6897 [Nonomuraea gerenzanensis]
MGELVTLGELDKQDVPFGLIGSSYYLYWTRRPRKAGATSCTSCSPG